jgi:membrane protein insertase Oxa1/YidC/SpoIIIJ
MGLSQVFAQRLQSTNIEDPTQKQMATLMPIMFVFILYKFASGLSLYWFVSNLWQIAFQVFVNERIKKEAEQKAHRAFDERQRALKSGEAAPFAKKRDAKTPGWRDKMMAYLETKAKESEKNRK